MALGIFKDHIQGASFVVIVIALPICTLATILRFVGTRRAGRRIAFEDWFVLGALLAFIGHVSLDLTVIFMLNGKSILALPRKRLFLVQKLSFSVNPLYMLNQFLAKLSIFCLYYRVFSIDETFLRWIYIIGFIHSTFSIATILVIIFGCKPIARGWNATIPGSCVTTAPHPFLAGTESVNSSVDFAMVILAIYMVQKMRLKTSIKWKLAILFALGGFSGVIGFIKIGQFYSRKKGTLTINETLGLWSIIQQAFSIICCSAPTYKNIFSPSAFWRALVSQVHVSWTSLTKGSRSLRTKPSRSFHRQGSSDQQKEEPGQREWLKHDQIGQNGFTRAEVIADHDAEPANEPGYPMKTLQVHQSVDMV